MFDVRLWGFNKKYNSTKQPSNDDSRLEECELKNNCKFLEPILQFNYGVTFNPTGYNYCYISAFGRYYFINEWEWNDGLWYAYCYVDVLASWKNVIGESTLYVLRSSSDYNGEIVDKLYPFKTGTTFSNSIIESGFTTNYRSGTFIVGIVGGSTTMGCTTYYCMSFGQFAIFASYLFNTDFFEGLEKNVLNPIQYVVSCEWFPYSIGGSVENGINIGWWHLPCAYNGILADNNQVRTSNTFSYSIPLISNPSANYYGSWLNDNPYRRLSLYVPGIGNLQLDSNNYKNSDRIYLVIDVDHITGIASIGISPRSDMVGYSPVEYYESKFSVSINLAQISADYIGAVQNAIGSVFNGAIGNYIGMAYGIGNMLESLSPKASTTGTNGNLTKFKTDYINLIHYFLTPVNDNVELNGRPLCEKRKINTLSGFILVEKGLVEGTFTDREKQDIKNKMESGFYYE